MNTATAFIRPFFLLLSLFLITLYAITNFEGGISAENLLVGGGIGLAFSLFLVGSEKLFQKSQLKGFNTAILGLFFGYLMGQAIIFPLETILQASRFPISSSEYDLIQTLILLSTSYIACNLTAKAADDLSICLPFIKFKQTSQKKKDLLIDASTLLDPRLVDLAASGLLDQHLLIPRFTIKEFNDHMDALDDGLRSKARRGIEVLKRLDQIPSLELRYVDTDSTDTSDSIAKLIRLARMHNANIFTADINKIQQSAHDGIKIISIQSLSNALKPITQNGEQITIKVQRYGKEPRQGVGYLEDGTMVVINGGAEFIGEIIKASVLSVKHTSSGRMIFCNATEEETFTEHDIGSEDAIERNRSCFSV